MAAKALTNQQLYVTYKRLQYISLNFTKYNKKKLYLYRKKT